MNVVGELRVSNMANEYTIPMAPWLIGVASYLGERTQQAAKLLGIKAKLGGLYCRTTKQFAYNFVLMEDNEEGETYTVFVVVLGIGQLVGNINKYLRELGPNERIMFVLVYDDAAELEQIETNDKVAVENIKRQSLNAQYEAFTSEWFKLYGCEYGKERPSILMNRLIEAQLSSFVLNDMYDYLNPPPAGRASARWALSGRSPQRLVPSPSNRVGYTRLPDARKSKKMLDAIEGLLYRVLKFEPQIALNNTDGLHNFILRYAILVKTNPERSIHNISNNVFAIHALWYVIKAQNR